MSLSVSLCPVVGHWSEKMTGSSLCCSQKFFRFVYYILVVLVFVYFFAAFDSLNHFKAEILSGLFPTKIFPLVSAHWHTGWSYSRGPRPRGNCDNRKLRNYL